MSDANERHPAGTPPQRLTRADVARLLETSIASVRRMEGKTLHPIVAPDGTHVFDPAEVAKLAEARSPGAAAPATAGTIAARVFGMFEERKTLREIVIALEVTPQLVRELYREYRVDLRTGERRRRDAEIRAAKEKQQREQEARDQREDRESERKAAAAQKEMLHQMEEAARPTDERIARMERANKEFDERYAKVRARLKGDQ